MTEYDDRAGDPVLAVHTINNDEKYVSIFGRGKILGASVPDDTAVGAIAERVRRDGDKVPKIELNSGEIIWGCECWWMDAYRGEMWLMELKSVGYEIRDSVSITDMRKEYLEKEDDDGKEIS